MATGEIVKPREIVKANNELFRCKYKLKDVVAGRIFMAFASLVDHKDVQENQSFVEYKISTNDILSDSCDGGDNYNQLREAAWVLVDHKIEQRKNDKHFAVYTLFSKIEYENGILTGQFHKDLVPFFIIAREKFTKLKLTEYMQLPSIYSQSMFGFLKSWSDRPEITVKLSELHEMLDTPQSFRKDFFNFKARVLDKAHKDINDKTSLHFEYEAIKTGRSVKEVKFRFVKKPALPARIEKQEEDQEITPLTDRTKHLKFHEFIKRFGRSRTSEAWPVWLDLFLQEKAPLAEDVPADNALGIMEFLKQWQESHQ